MSNPFFYGGIAGNGSFCNRKQELNDLTDMLVSGSRCFLYAERRMGKTSLARKAIDALPANEYLPIYVDLWPTDNSAAFVETTARAITQASETKAGKLLEVAKALFSRLKPSVTVDDGGQPKVEFGMGSGSASKLDLTEALDAPEALAKRLKKKVVVVFDEFQQITQYDDDLTERQLRSSIQHHKHVSYLFLGSRKHLLQSMFLDQSRPLYRSAAHYPLGAIATEHWLPFITSRFRKTKKKINKATTIQLCEQTEGHPFYTQHLCHVLWSMTAVGEEVQPEQIDAAVTELLRRESHAYVTLWEMLTRNEQRLLRGLANSEPPIKPFSAAFTREFGLRSASNSQRASESLLQKDIIDREEQSFVITDRFLRLWIQRTT